MNFSDLSWEEKMILEVAQPLGQLQQLTSRSHLFGSDPGEKHSLPNCCENQSFILWFPNPSFHKHIMRQLLLHGLHHLRGRQAG